MPRAYRRVQKREAVTTGVLLNADVSTSEIARRLERPESTVRTIVTKVIEGDVAGYSKGYTVARYWQDVEKEARRQLVAFDGTVQGLQELMTRAVPLLADELTSGDVHQAVKSIASLTSVALKGRGEYSHALKGTGDEQQGDTKEKAMTNEELLQRLATVKHELNTRVTEQA